MKKILFIFLILWVISCKDSGLNNNPESSYNAKWLVDVEYLNNTRDTIVVLTKDYSTNVRITFSDNIPVLKIGWETYAINVKSFNIISRKEL